jgi:hypothetical protein
MLCLFLALRWRIQSQHESTTSAASVRVTVASTMTRRFRGEAGWIQSITSVNNFSFLLWATSRTSDIPGRGEHKKLEHRPTVSFWLQRGWAISLFDFDFLPLPVFFLFSTASRSL